IGGPHHGDPPIVRIRRLYVQAEVSNFGKPVVKIQEVRARGLEVFVDRFLDGSDNWPRPHRRGGGGKANWELDIDSLEVRDGVFRYHDENLPMSLAARR